jgi:hypothetical protein
VTAFENTGKVDDSMDFNETHVTRVEHVEVYVFKIYSVWLVCYTGKYFPFDC